MAFYLDLFTPETWDAFRRHGGEISGFRQQQKGIARRIAPGDIFLCYLVRLSRWCGALEVTSEVFHGDNPIFSDPDPFVVRFRVRPIVALDPEKSLPIFEDHIWNHLSETKSVRKGTKGWAIPYRGSLRRIADSDGALLFDLLRKQGKAEVAYPLTERDRRQLARKRVVRTLTGEVEVAVPEADDDEEIEASAAPHQNAQTSASVVEPETEARQSIQMQARLAQIGAKMGFHIWVPTSDRNRVSELVPIDVRDRFLDVLPLNYDDTTLDTVKNIDVLWLKGRSMARAFEVEHTTAIYSGLLRMADLLALQPNMQIKLHIVAPEERSEKVRREIMRPVFSLLDNGPLYKKCTFLSYDSVEEIVRLRHLHHTSDTILDEYEERADSV